MSAVALAGMWALAAVLLFASVSKAVRPAATETMLLHLGFAPAVARIGRFAAPAGEAATAALVLISPASVVAQVAVVALFSSFAGAAVHSKVTGRRVRCACFGASRGSELGWQQLAWSAIAVALVVLTAMWPPSGPTGFDETLAVLASGCLLVSVALVLSSGPTWRAVRSARLSLQESRVAVKRIASEIA